MRNTRLKAPVGNNGCEKAQKMSEMLTKNNQYLRKEVCA